MIQLRFSQLSHYRQLMRVDRPIGTYLVAWPALWALWIAAQGTPDWLLVAVFLLGSFLMRSAGCVINDFADRNIDGHIQRTAQRPLATGAVTSGEALQLFVLLCLCSAALLPLTNSLTVLLSFGAVLLAAIYPFMKRFTHFPQLVLGMAFSCSIPMSFAAQSGVLPSVVWQLYIAVVIWVIVYDTFYAMVDREDDLKIGVKSTAIFFGRFDKSITALLQMVFVTQMILIGVTIEAGNYYFSSIIFAGGLFVYQQWLIINRDKEQCFKAFLNNHYVGMVIFIGIVLDYAFPI